MPPPAVAAKRPMGDLSLIGIHGGDVDLGAGDHRPFRTLNNRRRHYSDGLVGNEFEEYGTFGRFVCLAYVKCRIEAR